MARYGARTNYLLARHKAKDKQKLERAIKSAEAKAEKNKMWSTIGRTAGVIAGVALAPVTGGASLALAAGAGSYAGSKLGDMAVGGEDTLDYKGRFYKEEARDIQGQLSKADKAEATVNIDNAPLATSEQTVAQLKEILKERNLPTTGRKAELVNRVNSVELVA